MAYLHTGIGITYTPRAPFKRHVYKFSSLDYFNVNKILEVERVFEKENKTDGSNEGGRPQTNRREQKQKHSALIVIDDFRHLHFH